MILIVGDDAGLMDPVRKRGLSVGFASTASSEIETLVLTQLGSLKRLCASRLSITVPQCVHYMYMQISIFDRFCSQLTALVEAGAHKRSVWGGGGDGGGV